MLCEDFFKLLVNSSFFVKQTNFLDKLDKLVWNRAIAGRKSEIYFLYVPTIPLIKTKCPDDFKDFISRKKQEQNLLRLCCLKP